MRDSHDRVIDYLRISVTDRCNFRCGYCMPPEGVKLLEASEIVSYEELLRVITIFGKQGISKIRITGGEPLVRKGIVDFIRNIRAIGTIKDVAMTTNGSLLGEMAHELKAAGLDRVNISLDTLDPLRFSRITDRGKVEDTLRGINSAFEAGLNPVKLNVVMTEALSEADVYYFVEQVYKYPLAVRFIEYMPIGRCRVKPGPSIAEVKRMISKASFLALQPAENVKGNGPAKYYRLPRALGVFGFITPITNHFCHDCNRIRLTADGKLKPCLLGDTEIDIKSALRDGSDDSVISELFQSALSGKPDRHGIGMTKSGENLKRGMFQVGG
jgi:cyclic pyranopterin phosphate synthase